MGFDLTRVVRGRVWKFGDSVESDAINPYYQYPTMDELKQHTMEAYRPEFPQQVKARRHPRRGTQFRMRLEPSRPRTAGSRDCADHR
jgi:hypothetical protein